MSKEANTEARSVAANDDEMFGSFTPADEIRTLLRTVMSAEEIAAIPPDELSHVAGNVAFRLQRLQDGRALIARHVAEGRLSRHAAERMTTSDIERYVNEETSASLLRREIRPRPQPVHVEPAPNVPPPVDGQQIGTLLADMLSILVAQQEQINELVYERDAFLARFGERILDRFQAFSDGGRDYEGLEVTIDLEDDASERREQSQSGSAESQASTSNARHTHADFKLLASQIGGLGNRPADGVVTVAA